MRLFVTFLVFCLGTSAFAATERYTIAATAGNWHRIDWVVTVGGNSGHFEYCEVNTCSDLTYGRELKSQDLSAVMPRLQENMNTIASSGFFRSQIQDGIRNDYFLARMGSYFGGLMLATVGTTEYLMKKSPETIGTAGLGFAVIWGALYLMYRVEKSTAPTLEQLAEQMKPLLADPAHAKPLELTYWQIENFSQALQMASAQVRIAREN